MTEVFKRYREVQKHLGSIGHGVESKAALIETLSAAAEYVSNTKKVELKSKVPGKSYFGFASGDSISRPVNHELYLEDYSLVERVIRALHDRKLAMLDVSQINRAVYSAAITFCAGIDITKKGDQKTPGTLFEYLCATLLSSLLMCSPKASVQVLNMGFETKLPTDLIFDLGDDRPKYHVPVKTSTRERVIQVWAHQRVLDGVYGAGRFRGMPVILTETKLDSKNLEVTEICLPKQWLLYQMHIAQLWRIAYLDMPDAYARLCGGFPQVPVCTLGDVILSGDLPITPVDPSS
ncbi:MAG: hypothetical protein IAE77_09050 [Prosthecobacter sp.]|jgi:hypothetical protein|uniref:hypothetical protein n=1 Tax=Prosthecobacter sp. TaxID=1965333 RepID=UPI0019FB2157|nr:hypothetical protein [Prosthecobacter sp.]MBE2283588.1 hypothetical protein [Prosthecobacter sp.]